jgi:meiotically up-regulated gene 157 (Mug157) protein
MLSSPLKPYIYQVGRSKNVFTCSIYSYQIDGNGTKLFLNPGDAENIEPWVGDYKWLLL